MRKDESRVIGEWLRECGPAISPMIDLGSGTRQYRETESPWIDREVFAPLRKMGVRIIHSDMKVGDGVDIAGDILSREMQDRLRAERPNSVLTCNTVEHVESVPHFLAACDAVLPAGGLLVITAPRSYPYHLDPIDNYFRPSPADLAAMLSGYDLIRSGEIRCGSYYQDARGLWWLRDPLKLLDFRGGLEKWKARSHRMLWLFRPYIISAAILRKR